MTPALAVAFKFALGSDEWLVALFHDAIEQRIIQLEAEIAGLRVERDAYRSQLRLKSA